MFKNLIDIDFHSIEVAIPAFLTIILMPLTYSISTGITFGFISYALIQVVSGKTKEIKPTMWVIVALSVVELLFWVSQEKTIAKNSTKITSLSFLNIL